MPKRSTQRHDLVEPELSYHIVGILFDVYNTLGHGHQERIYQRGVREALRKNNIRFREQVPSSIIYEQKTIGRYFFDFLIEEKIILELKQGDRFSRKNFDQVTAYLQSSDIPLAILANFGTQGVVYKRVLKPTNS